MSQDFKNYKGKKSVEPAFLSKESVQIKGHDCEVT